MIQITAEEFYNTIEVGLKRGNGILEDINQLLAQKQTPPSTPQKKKVKWEYRIKEKQSYYYINANGEVSNVQWKNVRGDIFRYIAGNCTLTYQEINAKRRFDLLFADYCELIRQTNKKVGLVLDWGDKEQKKTYLYYNHCSNELHTCTIQTGQDRNDKEYWLIEKNIVLPLCREYFTDLELKAIATKNHKLLMEDNNG